MDMGGKSFTIKCRGRRSGDTTKATLDGSRVIAPAGWLADRAPTHEGEIVAGTCPDHSETIRIV
jgi:hypothetical protein